MTGFTRLSLTFYFLCRSHARFYSAQRTTDIFAHSQATSLGAPYKSAPPPHPKDALLDGNLLTEEVHRVETSVRRSELCDTVCCPASSRHQETSAQWSQRDAHRWQRHSGRLCVNKGKLDLGVPRKYSPITPSIPAATLVFRFGMSEIETRRTR